LLLFSFGGYGLALAALALVVFGAIEYPPICCVSLNQFPKPLTAASDGQLSSDPSTFLKVKTHFHPIVTKV